MKRAHDGTPYPSSAQSVTSAALLLGLGALAYPLGYLIGLHLAGRHHLAIKE